MSSVVVIGAGHIGIACAHYLRAEGYDVTVIDQGEIGQACSRANCGFLVPSHVMPLTTPANLLDGFKSLFKPRATFRFQPQLRSALYRWMFQFARHCTHRQASATAGVLQQILDESMRQYQVLFDEFDLQCDQRGDGLLFIFKSNEALEHFSESEVRLGNELGVQARYLSGEDLAALEPALQGDLSGAFHYPNDAFLRPDKLNSSWSDALVDGGVTFHTHCAMTGIESENGKIAAIETSNGRMVADQYVFAMGAWSPKFADQLRCDIPIEPGKGYSVTVQSLDKQPRYPMLFPEANIGVTPFADRIRFGSMMEFVGYNDTIPEYRIQQLIESAKGYLEVPAEPDVDYTWYGWRPMTWDGLPIIGRVPQLSNAVLAAGHNMLGLTLAPFTGKAVADIVQERSSPLPLKALSPLRFS